MFRNWCKVWCCFHPLRSHPRRKSTDVLRSTVIPTANHCQFFALDQLRATNAISGRSVPIISCMAAEAGAMIHLFGPESIGGIGDNIATQKLLELGRPKLRLVLRYMSRIMFLDGLTDHVSKDIRPYRIRILPVMYELFPQKVYLIWANGAYLNWTYEWLGRQCQTLPQIHRMRLPKRKTVKKGQALIWDVSRWNDTAWKRSVFFVSSFFFLFFVRTSYISSRIRWRIGWSPDCKESTICTLTVVFHTIIATLSGQLEKNTSGLRPGNDNLMVATAIYHPVLHSQLLLVQAHYLEFYRRLSRMPGEPLVVLLNRRCWEEASWVQVLDVTITPGTCTHGA